MPAGETRKQKNPNWKDVYQVTVAVQHDSWAVYRMAWRSWSVVNSVCLLDVLSAQGTCRFSICRCLAKSLDSTNWIDMETSELVGRCSMMQSDSFRELGESCGALPNHEGMRDWFHLIPVLLFKLQFPHWAGNGFEAESFQDRAGRVATRFHWSAQKLVQLRIEQPGAAFGKIGGDGNRQRWSKNIKDACFAEGQEYFGDWNCRS